MKNTKKVLLTLMNVLVITAGALGVASCGSDNKSSSIGSSASSSEGLKYTLNENDNSYTLSDIGTCTDTDIVIPSVYNGYPITSIGYGAFANCDSLTSIVIPDGVTSIGEYAFRGCSRLTSVTIGNGVTSIGERAFSNCSSLTSVTIGNGVTSIGKWTFLDCVNLTSILVGENNTAYQSIDGNLYSKDGKTLIQYAIGKTAQSFTIPDSVTSIGERAFSYCRSLRSIEIPDSITSIGYGAFEDCSSLTSIEIPDGVTSIGEYAFEDCSSLTSVTFKNTSGWTADDTSISSADLENPSTAAKYLALIYYDFNWTRS